MKLIDFLWNLIDVIMLKFMFDILYLRKFWNIVDLKRSFFFCKYLIRMSYDKYKNIILFWFYRFCI